jgi:mannose-6-phosphate isomerase-like protein (cupin superfamily)
MDRRDFAAMAPAFLAMATLAAGKAEAQYTGPPGADPKPKQSELKELTSGTFKPGPGYGSLPKRVSHRYLIGMLKAGNIRLEMHETIQEPGALHEPVDTHLHSEIWCVREGVGELFINGETHRMEVGDVGLVCAGDKHWIRNAGEGQLAYFVITVGPPEP